MKFGTTTLLCGTLSAAVAGTAAAGNAVDVTDDITTSTTWTADNVYNLTGQIFVKDGATLTIEAGTRIATTPTDNGSGALAVTRGSKIEALGTADAPIVFTSTADDGTWRPTALEWGNLTIMGQAYISENVQPLGFPENSPTPSPSNRALMEGLVADDANATEDVVYGGGNDDDNSGTLNFVSFRYGGRVIGLADELNGLSLGGIGRETDIQFVEIMNNVDDGIEIWGGTVDLKYFSVWNIGDDSFDVDQGWRGRAQFGVVVQGYSLEDASQGSGVGDNAFEIDGAEDSFWQPVTTTTLYNLTVIGQPGSDGLTTWRDNARVQYRQSIFMDGGGQLVRNDGDDGDGASGYGAQGTLTFDETWNTAYTEFSSVNAPDNPEDFYTAQFSGNLAEITDSVIYNVASLTNGAAANVESLLTSGSANNVDLSGSSSESDRPIVAISRDLTDVDGDGVPGLTTGQGDLMLRVDGVDLRPAGAAVTSASSAPADTDFWCPRDYRGAYGPNENWLAGWTAADEFGFIATPGGFSVDPCGNDPVDPCPTDLDGDDVTDFNDLLAVLNGFGTDSGDVNGDGETDFDDVLGVLNAFGPCP